MIGCDPERDPANGTPDGLDPAAGPEGRRETAAPQARAVPMVDARLDSRDLFAGGRVVTIAHGEHLYQLRLTNQNKLILTK